METESPITAQISAQVLCLQVYNFNPKWKLKSLLKMSLSLNITNFLCPQTTFILCPCSPQLVLLNISHSPNIDVFSALIIFPKVMTLLHLARAMLLAQEKSRVWKLYFSEKKKPFQPLPTRPGWAAATRFRDSAVHVLSPQKHRVKGIFRIT